MPVCVCCVLEVEPGGGLSVSQERGGLMLRVEQEWRRFGVCGGHQLSVVTSCGSVGDEMQETARKSSFSMTLLTSSPVPLNHLHKDHHPHRAPTQHRHPFSFAAMSVFCFNASWVVAPCFAWCPVSLPMMKNKQEAFHLGPAGRRGKTSSRTKKTKGRRGAAPHTCGCLCGTFLCAL